MYYDANKNIVEAHDDTTVQSAVIEHQPDGKHLLHVTYALRPGDYNDVKFLHSTNGINHRHDPVDHIDTIAPIMDLPTQELPAEKKGKK